MSGRSGSVEDPFDDLAKLTLPPDLAPPPPRPRKARQRIDGEFYLCPVRWADRAAAVLGSADQLIIALRIYRRWRTRRSGEATITVSRSTVKGSPRPRQRACRKLLAAGLVEVVTSGPRRAPRVKVVEHD